MVFRVGFEPNLVTLKGWWPHQKSNGTKSIQIFKERLISQSMHVLYMNWLICQVSFLQHLILNPVGVGDRNRTCIKLVCNQRPNRSATHPHNWRRVWESNPLTVSLRWQISNLLHYHPAQSPNLAEAVRFELTEHFCSSVFKTGAISQTLPHFRW